MVDFINQGADEGNSGDRPDRHPLKAAYEDSRLQDLPLGQDYSTRSLNVREEQGVTYGKKKFNFFVDEALPAFVRENHTNFTFFIQTFYDWLHEENNIGKLPELRDLDLAEDKFLIYYKNMLAKNYPESARLNWSDPSDSSINVRTLLRNVRDLYLSKSTDEAINFFFRSLFAPVGTDLYKVKIDYPKERLLRLSDGLWSPGASSGTPNAPVAGAELGRPEKN